MLTTSLIVSLSLGAQSTQPPQFEPPVRLQAAGAYVRTEAPGYASPTWHDVDGDGHADLIVGQFHDGKMRVFRGSNNGELQKGAWLQAEGDVAQVPGVW